MRRPQMAGRIRLARNPRISHTRSMTEIAKPGDVSMERRVPLDRRVSVAPMMDWIDSGKVAY